MNRDPRGVRPTSAQQPRPAGKRPATSQRPATGQRTAELRSAAPRTQQRPSQSQQRLPQRPPAGQPRQIQQQPQQQRQTQQRRTQGTSNGIPWQTVQLNRPAQGQKRPTQARATQPRQTRPAAHRPAAGQPRTGQPAQTRGIPQQRPAAPQRPPRQVQQPRQAQQSRPQQGRSQQRQAQQRRTQPGGRRSATGEWIYPERSRRQQAAAFETYYQKRREEERRREEAERQRQLEKERQEQMRRRRGILATIRAVLIRFLVVFALTCLGVTVAYFSVFHSRTQEFSDSVRYVLEGETSYTASAADAYYDGVLYTNFTKLSEYLELPVTGTIHYTRFLLPDPDEPVPSAEGSGMEESVLFAVGSFTANINGENVDMAGPCRLTGTQLWVPLSFVESYLSGVTVERLDADNVKLSRTPVEGSDPKAKDPEREVLSFRVKPQFPIAPIVWEEE